MFNWNEDKNALLKATRGYSFNEVVEIMAKEGVLDNIKHPNNKKYPNQYIFIVRLNGYVHYIPYVIEDNNKIFLKNIIPSRKLNKLYKDKK